MEISEEILNKIPFVDVKVLGVEGKRVVAKIGKQRKPRGFIAYFVDDGTLIAQDDGTILQFVDLDNNVAIYNTKGEYFFHLDPKMGAKIGRFPDEFVEALKSVIYQEGEVIGKLPDELGGSVVVFGGAKTF